jgi:hypothetical protein
VELGPNGVWVKQLGNELVVPWDNVEGIEESADSIDFPIRHGGMIIVRKRAFGSVDEETEFMELAARHVGRAPSRQDQSPGV